MAMHPSNRRNIERGSYQLGKHPFYKKHGRALYNASHDYVAEKAQESWGQGAQQAYMRLFEVFQRIVEIEEEHKQELEVIAKRIVAEVWGCDPNIFNAKITTDQEDIAEQDQTELEMRQKKLPQPTPEQQKRIEQRVMMNQLTQGAAVHQYITLHYMAAEALNAINPELLELYSKLTTSSMSGYWMMDVESMLEQLGQHKAGSVKLELVEKEKYEEEEPGEGEPEEEEPIDLNTEDEPLEDDDSPKVIVKAAAMCFPVLCQELSKGLMMLATQHGINALDAPTAELVIHHADRMAHEPWQIKIGPALWQKFLKVAPPKLIPQVVAKLSMEDPDYAAEIINYIVENPEQAKKIMSNYVDTPLKEKEKNFYLDEKGNMVEEGIKYIANLIKE